MKNALFILTSVLVVACSSTVGDLTADARLDSWLIEASVDTTPIADSATVPDTQVAETTTADTARDTAEDASTDRPVVPPIVCTDALTIGGNIISVPRIVVPTGTWVPMSNHVVIPNANGDLVRVRVSVAGWSRSFQRIGVFVGHGVMDDRLGGMTTLPAGDSPAVDIDISPPYHVTRGDQFYLGLQAILADVVPLAAAAGDPHAPLSGMTVGLGLVGGYTGPGWGSVYAGHLNVMVLDASGSGVCARGESTPAYGNVVRKSMLVVSPLAVPTLGLEPDVDVALYSSFLYTYLPSSDAVVKKISYRFHFDCRDGSTLSLSNFRIRVDSTDHGWYPDVTIRTGDLSPAGQYRDVTRGSISCADHDGVIAVVFTTSVLALGGGRPLMLHATVGGASLAGDRVEIGLYRNPMSEFNLTGYLGRDDIATAVTSPTGGTMYVPGPNIEDSPLGTGSSFVGALIWSDLSDRLDRVNSRDWIDTYLLREFDRTNMFVR